jgi:hypothetical protein
MGRHERRSDIARFRRDASRSLNTYLCEPNDPALDGLLQRAARTWLDALSVRARACIVCSEWLWSRQGVGLLLLSTPSVVRPTSASVCGICSACAELPLPALEQAASNALQAAVPGGKFLDHQDTRR